MERERSIFYNNVIPKKYRAWLIRKIFMYKLIFIYYYWGRLGKCTMGDVNYNDGDLPYKVWKNICG